MTSTIEIRTADEFQSFLTIAVRGERALYHRGYLACDARGPSPTVKLLQATRLASDRGLAVLTQRRIGSHCYEYYATRC
jgi:hypothetical protein